MNIPQKITALADDLLQTVKSFDASLDMTSLCSFHTAPLLLYDNKPVMELTQDEFVGIFDYGLAHHFISPNQAFRLAVYCKLDLPSMIALILKSTWEIHFAEMLGYSESEMNLDAQMSNPDTLAEHLSGFTPANQTIYALVIQTPYKTNKGKTRENVNMIIYELMRENHFLLQNIVIAQVFPATDQTEATLLNNASDTQREEYENLKSLWKIKSTEFEDKLLQLERKKRVNIQITDRYFRAFGSLELKLSSLKCKTEKFHKVLELKCSNPDLGYREILKAAVEAMSTAEKKQIQLREKYARSLNCIEGFSNAGSNCISTKDFINYESACKQVLKQLYLLLHPDMYYYKAVSETDKQKLDELWLELMQDNEEKFVSYGSGLLLSSHPDYYKLKSMLKRVCKILNVDVDDLEVGDQLGILIKQGSSMKKLLAFLESDLESLQRHLSNIALKQYVYANDQQTQIYREALTDLDAHKEKLQSEILEATKEIIRLKAEVRMVFKNKAA